MTEWMSKNKNEYETKHRQGISFSYNLQEWSENKYSREGLGSYYCKGMQSIFEFFTRDILLHSFYIEKCEAATLK